MFLNPYPPPYIFGQARVCLQPFWTNFFFHPIWSVYSKSFWHFNFLPLIILTFEIESLMILMTRSFLTFQFLSMKLTCSIRMFPQIPTPVRARVTSMIMAFVHLSIKTFPYLKQNYSFTFLVTSGFPDSACSRWKIK